VAPENRVGADTVQRRGAVPDRFDVVVHVDAFVQDVLLRPHSAPSDRGLKETNLLGKLTDALSSLPRLHIQQLHTRLPVFQDLSLSFDASNEPSDVSSQVPPRPCIVVAGSASWRLQVADDYGHRNSSLMSMNWVAVNIKAANQEHRISKPEYVHVWVSPGCWLNMPQVGADACGIRLFLHLVVMLCSFVRTRSWL
jgi:hypothetical protein